MLDKFSHIIIMKCSENIYQITGFLSSIGIFVSLYGIYLQADNIKKKQNKLVYIFPAMLAITLLFRFPTIFCISLEHKEGWYSVVGIIIKIVSLIYLAYISHRY
jgi:hypothetical protein